MFCVRQKKKRKKETFYRTMFLSGMLVQLTVLGMQNTEECFHSLLGTGMLRTVKCLTAQTQIHLTSSPLHQISVTIFSHLVTMEIKTILNMFILVLQLHEILNRKMVYVRNNRMLNTLKHTVLCLSVLLIQGEGVILVFCKIQFSWENMSQIPAPILAF